MSNRRPMSKGIRFGIFARDVFTCQYCGRRPPEIVLEVDHIVPVADGGLNEAMNLVTSCSDCNRGKGRKRLENVSRPDADMAWLEMQQETAELRRYQEGKAERDALRAEIVEGFARMWCDLTGLDWYPREAILDDWLSKFGPELIEEAIRVVGPKILSGTLSGNPIAYTRGILNKLALNG